jgi:DNA-binding PadR family transcriptional regulator
MRSRAPWMKETDIAILEYFEEIGEIDETAQALRSGTVHTNLVEQLSVVDVSESTISRRMQKLAKASLLEQLPEKRGSYYRITDKGHAYLDGDIDAEDLQLEED